MARLRQKGMQMYEFGERVLQQGSYGDDVMQLQVGCAGWGGGGGPAGPVPCQAAASRRRWRAGDQPQARHLANLRSHPVGCNHAERGCRHPPPSCPRPTWRSRAT